MAIFSTPQGPTPMALGPLAFRALGFSFQDVSRELDTSWAEIEVVDRLNALQWTGPKSDDVTISGVLFPEEFGGLETLEGLRRAALAGRPLMLVTVAGDVRGSHVIQSISEDRSLHTRTALPRRNAYRLSLTRYTAGAAGGRLF